MNSNYDLLKDRESFVNFLKDYLPLRGELAVEADIEDAITQAKEQGKKFSREYLDFVKHVLAEKNIKMPELDDPTIVSSES